MEKERILIVDDDESLLHLMAMTVQRSGYQVETASDGLEALSILKQGNRFAVLLTDLMMPKIHGHELLREAQKIDPHIESIVITATASLESAIRALRADGAYDYLLKPLEVMGQLTVAVDRAVEHRRLKLESEALYAKGKEDAERLQALIANTGDAIISGDRTGTLTIANPAALRLIGKNDLVGQLAGQVLPPGLAGVLNNWLAMGRLHPAIIEVPWEKGQVQMVSLAPLAGASGGDGWVMVLRDITHFKKSDEIKAHLLSEAANKIRYPLAQAMSSLAELGVLSAENERAASALYNLTNIWGRVQEWVDNLPAMLQLDMGLPIHPMNVYLPAFLEQIRGKVLDERVQPHGVELHFDCDASLPMVRVDMQLFEQLIQVLTNRAILRSQRGETIRITARAHEKQVWLDISDAGPAIDENDLPHVFERSLLQITGGRDNAGLELPLAKAIVDRLGGQIWIGGQGPVGSTITICLPAVKSPNKDKPG